MPVLIDNFSDIWSNFDIKNLYFDDIFFVPFFHKLLVERWHHKTCLMPQSTSNFNIFPGKTTFFNPLNANPTKWSNHSNNSSAICR